MVQLVRLFVLFEDLKLEGMSLQSPHDPAFDASAHYRGMYYVRKAFGTIWEMDSAFHRLNMLREFKQRRRALDRRRLRDWNNAIQFFSRHKNFIDHQRNSYGGHVNDEAAAHVLSRVSQGDDSVGALTVKFTDEHTMRFVFQFAETIVDQALFIDRGERDATEFLRESFDILMGAIRHASHATQILTDIYLAPVFGWS